MSWSLSKNNIHHQLATHTRIPTGNKLMMIFPPTWGCGMLRHFRTSNNIPINVGAHFSWFQSWQVLDFDPPIWATPTSFLHTWHVFLAIFLDSGVFEQPHSHGLLLRPLTRRFSMNFRKSAPEPVWSGEKDGARQVQLVFMTDSLNFLGK